VKSTQLAKDLLPEVDGLFRNAPGDRGKRGGGGRVSWEKKKTSSGMMGEALVDKPNPMEVNLEIILRLRKKRNIIAKETGGPSQGKYYKQRKREKGTI